MALDLFCGAGGASLAMQQVGLEPVGFDHDRDACATHQAAGHATVRCDLSGFPWGPWAGKVDVMHGSPPCQPFSVAGHHRGEADSRDGMPWFLRAVEEVRPRLVTIENVPGLTNRRHRAYVNGFTIALLRLGYSVERRNLDAADFGTPQHRRRSIFVCRADGEPTRWPARTHGGIRPRLPLGPAVGIPRHAPLRLRPGYDGRNIRDYSANEPAPTIAFGHASCDWAWVHDDRRVRLVEPCEAAAWQGFPRDYPWRGGRSSQFRQIGNALPPQLLAAVLAANLDRKQVAA